MKGGVSVFMKNTVSRRDERCVWKGDVLALRADLLFRVPSFSLSLSLAAAGALGGLSLTPPLHEARAPGGRHLLLVSTPCVSLSLSLSPEM